VLVKYSYSAVVCGKGIMAQDTGTFSACKKGPSLPFSCALQKWKAMSLTRFTRVKRSGPCRSPSQASNACTALRSAWAAPELLLLGRLGGVLSCPFPSVDTGASSSRSSLAVIC